MNAGRILCSILLGMYAIYIIRNNTITIAGANTKRSILHSFSIFSLILAVLLWGEMFALKQNLNKYFMCKKGKSYGISIIGKGRIAVSVAQSILLIFLGIWSW
ncbi:MAG: hypothetical protein E7H05_06780 [Veillonella sp.]|nr:hypothetical protein [Veillonella sp.]